MVVATNWKGKDKYQNGKQKQLAGSLRLSLSPVPAPVASSSRALDQDSLKSEGAVGREEEQEDNDQEQRS